MILLYSGDCGVCRWVVRHIILPLDHHHRLDILPFRDPLSRLILDKHGVTELEQVTQHWWFIDSANRLWQGNRGGAKQVLLAFRRTRWLGRLIPSCCCNWLDNFVNRNHPLLAKWFYSDHITRRVMGMNRKQAA